MSYSWSLEQFKMYREAIGYPVSDTNAASEFDAANKAAKQAYQKDLARAAKQKAQPKKRAAKQTTPKAPKQKKQQASSRVPDVQPMTPQQRQMYLRALGL
jgi:sRNA-binding protein